MATPIFAGDSSAIQDLAKLVAKGKVKTWYLLYKDTDNTMVRAGGAENSMELLGMLHLATDEVSENV